MLFTDENRLFLSPQCTYFRSELALVPYAFPFPSEAIRSLS